MCRCELRDELAGTITVRGQFFLTGAVGTDEMNMYRLSARSQRITAA